MKGCRVKHFFTLSSRKRSGSNTRARENMYELTSHAFQICDYTVGTRLSEVRSWPSWTWVQTGLAPDFVGPGPGGEWTGPWGQTGVGPGLNLYFKFIVLCTVSNIILSFCNCFQEGWTWRSLKLFMHHRNESMTPIAGLSSLSLPCTTHFHKFLFHLFLCN